jgi:hypothetical protein
VPATVSGYVTVPPEITEADDEEVVREKFCPQTDPAASRRIASLIIETTCKIG